VLTVPQLFLQEFKVCRPVIPYRTGDQAVHSFTFPPDIKFLRHGSRFLTSNPYKVKVKVKSSTNLKRIWRNMTVKSVSQLSTWLASFTFLPIYPTGFLTVTHQ